MVINFKFPKLSIAIGDDSDKVWKFVERIKKAKEGELLVIKVGKTKK